jgi:SAM-dependent methyltransferase
MQRVTLAESGLGIAEDELLRLLEPFVDRSAGADAWRAEVARRRRKLAQRVARRLLMPWRGEGRRREATVVGEYDKAWRAIDYGVYAVGAPQRDHTPWQWGARTMFASDVGATRFRQLLLIRLIERVQPRSVLEIGCGNGINLILLAGRFPAIRFAGVELTAAGHEAARGLQARGALPPGMGGFAPLPLADPSAFQRIDFRRGNAVRLPFEDGAFDLVYTVLALEQMEVVRAQALAEIARVAARHTLMIEPFRDVNQALWPRLNVLRRDYFRGRIDDLRQHGLEPVLALDDFPQEVFLKACAVLAERRPGQPVAAAA